MLSEALCSLGKFSENNEECDQGGHQVRSYECDEGAFSKLMDYQPYGWKRRGSSHIKIPHTAELYLSRKHSREGMSGSPRDDTSHKDSHGTIAKDWIMGVGENQSNRLEPRTYQSGEDSSFAGHDVRCRGEYTQRRF